MVATRRSHSLDTVTVKPSTVEKRKSVDTKRNQSSSVKGSASKQHDAAMECDDEDIPVRHSARLRGEGILPIENSRPSKKSNHYLHDEFEWNSVRSSKRLATKKEYGDDDNDDIHTSSRNIEYAVGTRRSSRRRRPDFDEEDTYLQFAAETLAPSRSLRNSRRHHQSVENHDDDDIGENRIETSKKGKTRSELRDLLAAQGKNLSDVKAYTEPDIYSSVKSRVRSSTRTRLYEEFYTGPAPRQNRQEEAGEEEGSQSEETEEEEDEDGNSNDDQEETEEDEEEEEEDEGHPYRLRKVREAPQRYTIVRDVQRRRQRSLFDDLPSSPVHRRRKKTSRSSGGGPFCRRHRRATAQGNSSTSSEDSSSDDEIKFRKRQHKSMARARNQCLPINLSSADISKHSFARDRKKIGGSLADIDPMTLDTSVTFSSVGGHNKHIRALKEMVVFPLMYPEVFEKFSITPPRGCLFYGPPGTGKTLMARALANECSTDGKRVSFFMKKGADCLSKWIGESERQLRILFDQAYQMRPSIIFFDEIDGLAPVRSSRQDQIHSSIVSTLLALMDGLDGRGEVIVIGATNRIDSIDPALRRPGRFDREFLFPLPDKRARESILQIHTKAWNPQLKHSFIDYLAAKTVGYCGADLKALCTEAALFALRRRYPQIYASREKLQLNVGSIKIIATDFNGAVKNIIPTAQRSVSNPGRALSSTIKPLMNSYLQTAVLQLFKLFPVLKGKSKLIQQIRAGESVNQSVGTGHRLSDGESDNEVGVSMGGIYEGEPDGTSHLNSILPLLSGNNNGIVQSQYSSLLERLSTSEHSLSSVHWPRFIICGDSSTGHTSHLTPALLHDMEGIPIHCIDLPTLYGISVRSPEESCAQVFREARRLTPSIIFLPNAQQWWTVATHTVQATFESLLQDIPPHLPVLLLATANCSYRQLPRDFAKFFHSDFSEVYEMSVKFSVDERREFFAPIFLIYATTPPARNKTHSAINEVLAKAPAPEPAPLTQDEEKKLEKEEESTFRNLRLFLRDVLMRLGVDRRFKIFCKPVDFEEVPDYVEVIKSPMDFSTMHTKVDQHKYQTVAMFIEDIELICSNALEYNPDRRPEDKLIRHRACAMRDMAHAIVDTDLDPEFEKVCIEIAESRKRRGISMNKFAPKYYPVLPKHLMIDPITGEVTSKPDNEINSNSQNIVIQPTNVEIVDKTPNKLLVNRTTSTTRSKRKRSSWSRGILSSKKKKKVVRIEKEDDDEMKNNEDELDDNHLEHNGEISSEDENIDMDESNNVHEFNKVGEEDNVEDSLSVVPLEESFENGTAMDINIEQESNKDSLNDQENPLKSDVVDTHITNGFGLGNVPQDEIETVCFSDNDQWDTESQGPVKTVENDNAKQEDVITTEDNSGCPESDKTSEKDGKNHEPIMMAEDNNVDDDDKMDSSAQVEVNLKDKNKEQTLEGQGDSEITPTPPRRMTLRSRDRSISESNGVSKQEVSLPPPPPFIVDHKKLIHLLEEVVMVTDSYTVEELERVHSLLSRCVEKHKNNYDRTALTQELEIEITALSPRATT